MSQLNQRYRVSYAGSFFIVCIWAAFLFYQFAYVLPFVPKPFGILNTLLNVQILALLFSARFVFYGLFHVVLTYCLIFFGFVPPLEIINNVTYWGVPQNVFGQYVDATVICIFGIVFFVISYAATYGRQIQTSKKKYAVSGRRLIVISILATATIYAYNGFSIGSVMFRGGDFVQRISLGQSAWLIYQYFVYPLPSICVVAYLLLGGRRQIPILLLIVLFLLANPATGMARFQAATLYLAVLLALKPHLWEKRGIVVGLLFAGVFLVLPILDKFRHFSSETAISYSTSFIYAGHFDGFQMFALGLEEQIITWGRQLLGAFLFFVPRAIWANKPTSSGTFLAGSSNLDFDNISFPFFAEGYINFGILGVLLFAISIGVFAAQYDTQARRGGMNGPSLIYYNFAGGLLFFLMRGSLMNGIAFSAGAYAAVLCVYYLSKQRIPPQ
jgi:oligosaccharide repeat unit polymerase